MQWKKRENNSQIERIFKMKGGFKKYFLILLSVALICGEVKSQFVSDYMVLDNGKEYYFQIQNTPKSDGVALDYSIKRIYKKEEPYELTIYSNLPDYTRLNIFIKPNNSYEDSYAFDDQPLIDGKVTVSFGYNFPSDTSQIDIYIKYAFMAMPPKVVDGNLINHQPKETRLMLGESGEDTKIANISANKLSVRSSKEIDFHKTYYYFILKDSISMKQI